MATRGPVVPSAVELQRTQRGIEELVAVALEAATSLEEVVDCAHAAAAVGSPRLLALVAERVRGEVDDAMASSGAWEAELTYSKIDAWNQTGHKARLLAEAWGCIAPLLPRAGAAPA